MKNIKKIINTLFELGTLKKIIRSHRQSFLTNDLSDNIGSHSHRVSAIGYFLASNEKNVDIGKVLTMCIFHDLDESRAGDQNWIHKNYVKVFDNEILGDQFSTYPDLYKIMKEYGKRESIESKIAKDADVLDQMLLLKEYELQGNIEAKRWIRSKIARQIDDNLLLSSSKKLYKQILVTSPSEWWRKVNNPKRR
jgi:putative hydrolase of HD superfamily